MDCDHRATSKNDLTQLQQAVHEGKYPWNMTTRLQQKVMLINTSNPYMKEISMNAGNVTTRLLHRVISLNTTKLYIKERSVHAGNVNNRRPQ